MHHLAPVAPVYVLLQKIQRFTLSPAGISLFAGGLLPLAFAPVGLSGLAIISMAILFHCLSQATVKQASLYGLLFGIGEFSVGISWLYISIHDFGHAPLALAALITALFIAIISLYPAIMATVFAWRFNRLNTIARIAAFAALWTLSEWLRATLFSGFPWLLLGYSQSNVALSQLTPIIGIYGIGFLVALMGGALCAGWYALRRQQAHGYFLLALIALIYLLCDFIPPHYWTTIEGPAQTVSIIQGNQTNKWDPNGAWKSMDTYYRMTNQHWASDIIIWPESAIPMPYDDIRAYFDGLASKARQQNTALLVGIPRYAGNHRYYNAMIALGEAEGHYYKQHLVPFGEYLPIPWLIDIIRWFNIPMSEMVAGAQEKHLLQAKSVKIAPFICYEIAYSDSVRKALPEAQLMVTISDDAWFGHSFALAQHLQIAQMRAIQAGRYHVMVSNSGLSAIIAPDGQIIKRIPPFTQTSLSGQVFAMKGTTPWVYWGDAWIIALITLMVLLCEASQWHFRRRSKSATSKTAGIATNSIDSV